MNIINELQTGIIVDNIIDNILIKASKLLYNKYIENKITDFIGEYYSKNLMIPLNHLLYNCDNGENKQDMKNWNLEEYPIENKIDSWATYRLKVKKGSTEKIVKSIILPDKKNKNKKNRFSKKVSLKKLSSFSEISEQNNSFEKNKIIKNEIKKIKIEKNAFEEKIRIDKNNEFKIKQEETNYFLKKKEEEKFNIKQKKELEKKINKEDFTFDVNGNLIFLKKIINSDDLPITELKEINYDLSKEKLQNCISYLNNVVIQTLPYQEIENIQYNNNKLKINNTKDEIAEYETKMKNLPNINDEFEINNGVIYKIDKRVIKEGDKIINNKFSRTEFKKIIKTKNINSLKKVSEQIDNNIDQKSIKESCLKNSINSIKGDIEKGLRGAIFINPKLLFNLLKDINLIQTKEDEEKIKRKLKRKEHKVLVNKLLTVLKNNPEKYINRIITFQNDLFLDNNYKNIDYNKKQAITNFQKKILKFNNDLRKDKNQRNNTHVDQDKRKLLDKIKIPIKQLRTSSNYRIKNIKGINTLTQSNFNKNLKSNKIDKSNMMNYINNYNF